MNIAHSFSRIDHKYLDVFHWGVLATVDDIAQRLGRDVLAAAYDGWSIVGTASFFLAQRSGRGPWKGNAPSGAMGTLKDVVDREWCPVAVTRERADDFGYSAFDAYVCGIDDILNHVSPWFGEVEMVQTLWQIAARGKLASDVSVNRILFGVAAAFTVGDLYVDLRGPMDFVRIRGESPDRFAVIMPMEKPCGGPLIRDGEVSP